MQTVNDDEREAIARTIASFETPDAPLSATDPWDWLYWTKASRDRFYRLTDAIRAPSTPTDGEKR